MCMRATLVIRRSHPLFPLGVTRRRWRGYSRLIRGRTFVAQQSYSAALPNRRSKRAQPSRSGNTLPVIAGGSILPGAAATSSTSNRPRKAAMEEEGRGEGEMGYRYDIATYAVRGQMCRRGEFANRHRCARVKLTESRFNRKRGEGGGRSNAEPVNFSASNDFPAVEVFLAELANASNLSLSVSLSLANCLTPPPLSIGRRE